MCWKKIELHIQNVLTILDTIVVMMGVGGMWLYDMLITWRFFASTMNKIFIQTPKPYMENGYMHNVNMVIILH